MMNSQCFWHDSVFRSQLKTRTVRYGVQILAFCCPIGDDCSTFWGKFIPAENEKMILARMWQVVNLSDMIQFFHSPSETRTVRCQTVILVFHRPILDECSKIPKANSFQQKMKRWFWLECDKGSNFFSHESIFHSPLETRTVWCRV